jgi:hypothetical protein
MDFMNTAKRKNSWLRSSNALALLLALCCCYNTQAGSVIDHVNTSQDDAKEIVEIVFNKPVQYLYHTPKSDTKTMLLGFYIHPPKKKGLSRHRPVSFKRAELLESIEIFHEQGFNPHLYLEFSSPVNVTVQPSKNLRGFILTISKQEK